MANLRNKLTGTLEVSKEKWIAVILHNNKGLAYFIKLKGSL